MKRIGIIIVLAFIMPLTAVAQYFTGLPGLLHTPSAEMDERGTARISFFRLDDSFIPSSYGVNSYSYSIAFAPYDWMEASFTGIVRKPSSVVYQDRMISLKLRPLKEGRFCPAVVLGTIDPLSTIKTGSDDNSNNHFSNYYISAAKHFNAAGEWGIHLSYRYFTKTINKQWNGLVGGINYNPSFAPFVRLAAEYDGCYVNVGMDALLFRHLRVQALLQDFKRFCCGIGFELNLL